MKKKKNSQTLQLSPDSDLLFSSEYLLLYDRSMKIFKDWKQGKLSNKQYEILMNTTLSEIRQVIRNEQKAGKEKEEAGS